MIRDITLGQYYQADSVIHRLDSRTKLLGSFIYILSLFLFTNKYVYLIALGFFIIVRAISKVPFRFIVKGMKPIWFILIVTAIMNIFLTKGDVIIELGLIKISNVGLRNAIYMSFRLVLLILGSSILTLTTTPNNLTDGLEKVLGPLKIIKVPVHEMAMIMSIALRFIPILLEEADKIIKAQLSRGADFESGNIFKRVKNMIPILVPLFVSAFRRANDLAMAMEARCYRGEKGRTKMKPLKYYSRDYISYSVLILYLGLIIISGIMGYKVDVLIGYQYI